MFKNEDTHDCCVIISNDRNFYEKRKSFKDSKSFERFYSTKADIYRYCRLARIDWDEVFNYFQNPEN